MEPNNVNVTLKDLVKYFLGYVRYNYLHFLLVIIFTFLTALMSLTDGNEILGIMIVNLLFDFASEVPAASENPSKKWSYTFILGAFAVFLLCTIVGIVSQVVFREHYLRRALTVEEPIQNVDAEDGDDEDEDIDPEIVAVFEGKFKN